MLRNFKKLVLKQGMIASAADADSYLITHQAQRVKEKKDHGEVFTPVSVIDTMLAMLPTAVWKDKGLRWCDPACGIGQFALKAIFGGVGYSGLLVGLRSQFVSDSACLKHILETMFVCYDINAENASATRKLLKSLCDGSPQVETRDYLVGDSGPFDIILGNPPYNAGGTKREGEKRLHIRFVEKALNSLQKKGYLLFVCPPNYREAGSSMNRLFLEHVGFFQSIRMYGPDETHRLFKIQSRVDAFLWQSGAATGKTEIVDIYGGKAHVELDLTRHVPNFGFSLFEKLRHTGSAQVHAFRTAEATTISCAKSGFSAGGKHKTLHLLVEGGRKILLRNRPHSLEGVPKLILNGLGIPYVYYDSEGEYGVTQVPVVVKNPSAELVRFMKSPLFYCIAWALRITGNNNLPYLFRDIPADYGAGLRLSAAETELVNRFVVPTYADADLIVECSGGRSKTRKRSSTRRVRD
jgi:hypothetical protein